MILKKNNLTSNLRIIFNKLDIIKIPIKGLIAYYTLKNNDYIVNFIHENNIKISLPKIPLFSLITNKNDIFKKTYKFFLRPKAEPLLRKVIFDLYNQNFFLVSVAKTRQVVLALSQKLQDAANALRSNINSASSKVLLAFQSFSENRYSTEAKEFTISAKTIAVLDQMFSDDAGLLAIPTVKGISGKEALAKLEAEGGETSSGVPIAKVGDLGAMNVTMGFGFAGSDAPEGFAGTGFDSTGAGVTDPEFGGNQGGTPPDPPPGVPGSGGGGGTGGGTGGGPY